jgi:hypothetical protein
MTKTPFVTLLVCLAVVAGGLFVWAGSEPHVGLADLPTIEAFEDESYELAVKPIADDTSDEDLTDANLEDLEDVPEGLRELAREEIEGEGAQARFLVVQVWKGKKGVPAAEADVFFLEGYDGPEIKDPYAQHKSDLAEKHGQRFKTDDRGRVELPVVQAWAMVSVQQPGLHGFKIVNRRHRRVESITLLQDETVTVRVVDAEGQPVAGIPVGVAQWIPKRRKAVQTEKLLAQMKQLEQQAADVRRSARSNPNQKGRGDRRLKEIRSRQVKIKRTLSAGKGSSGSERGRGRSRIVTTKTAESIPWVITTSPDVRACRRTDAAGLAVFEHFQAYRRYQEKWWPQEHIDQFEAVLLMPLPMTESRVFHGRPVPTETMELQLPATGSIALRTVDLDGRPYTHPVHMDLRLAVEEAMPWTRLRQRKEQNRDEIVFPFVGLGLQFTLSCRLDDDDFRWQMPLFAGPVNPGEQVSVDVVVAPKDGMLFGRLLSQEGQPLAGLRPSFLINTSIGRLEGEDVTTDDDGRFHLPYQVRNSHLPPYRLEIRNKGARPVAGLAMRLPGLPAGRITDLGDLQLDGFGAIAYGMVVDDRGEPVKGAALQLQRERQMSGKKLKMTFVDEAFVVGATDAEGHYEMFGELEPGRYRLRVRARGHFSLDSRDLRAGEQLDLQVLRNSKVVGTVLVPSWMSSKNLRTTLQSADNPTKRRVDRIRDYLGKKFIYFDNVRPGIYSLLIHGKDFPDPIWRIDALQILPGQTGIHPRLVDIDFTGFLHHFVLTAVNGHGQPIQPKWPLIAKVMRPGGEMSSVGFAWKGSKLEVVSASPELAITAFSSGYVSEPTVLPSGTSQVLFLQVPPVELSLPGLRGLVGKALVWVKLQPIKSTGMPRSLTTWNDSSNRIGRQYSQLQRRNFATLLGQGDTVQIPMMLAGKFQVRAYLLGTTKSRKARAVRLECGEVDIRLIPGAGPQQITANVDPKKVQDGLAALLKAEAAAGAGK